LFFVLFCLSSLNVVFLTSSYISVSVFDPFVASDCFPFSALKPLFSSVTTSLSRFLSLTHTLTHAHTLTHPHPDTPPHTHTHHHTHTPSHTHTHTLTHTHTHPDTHPHTHTHTLYFMSTNPTDEDNSKVEMHKQLCILGAAYKGLCVCVCVCVC